MAGNGYRGTAQVAKRRCATLMPLVSVVFNFSLAMRYSACVRGQHGAITRIKSLKHDPFRMTQPAAVIHEWSLQPSLAGCSSGDSIKIARYRSCMSQGCTGRLTGLCGLRAQGLVEMILLWTTACREMVRYGCSIRCPPAKNLPSSLWFVDCNADARRHATGVCVSSCDRGTEKAGRDRNQHGDSAQLLLS